MKKGEDKELLILQALIHHNLFSNYLKFYLKTIVSFIFPFIVRYNFLKESVLNISHKDT